jgi:hypothetical protein
LVTKDLGVLQQDPEATARVSQKRSHRTNQDRIRMGSFELMEIQTVKTN